MDRRRITGKYMAVYTATFAVLCAVVFLPFALAGKSLIGNGDGQSQYILQLAYMGRWLREALAGFLHGDFTPACYDLAIGMGDDINAVVRFHPLDFLSVLVPEAGTEILYHVLIFLRLYLAGLTFSAFAFAWRRYASPEPREGSRDAQAVLTGCIVYLFCGYTFSLGIVHPTYLSPLVTLPLLFLGAERVMQEPGKHRFVLFSVITAVSFVSNYYFMYIASVAVFLYVFVRFFQVRKTDRVRQFCTMFIRFTAAYVLGVMLSAVTLLPALARYTSSYRSDRLTQVNNLLIYADRRRYLAWLVNLISPLRASGNGTHLNFAVLALPALVMLFAVSRERGDAERRGEERVFLRIASLVLLAFLLIPAGGYLMAALNNENNRWVFLISLLCGGAVSFSFTDLMEMERRQRRALVVCCLVFDLLVAGSALIMGPDLYNIAAAAELTLLTGLLIIPGMRRGEEARGRSLRGAAALLTAAAVLSTAVNGAMTFGAHFGNLPQYYMRWGKSLDWYRKSPYADYLQVQDPDALYRVDGLFAGNSEDNASLLLGYRGIQVYNSVLNAHQIGALMETENISLTTMLHITGLDGRTGAEALAGVRYFMTDETCSACLPYGYAGESVWTDGTRSIYENRLALPLSCGTARVMKRSEFDQLTAVEKEYAMLEVCVLSDEDAASFDGELLTAEEYRASCGIETVSVENVKTEGKIGQEADGTQTVFRVRRKSGSVTVPYRKRAGYSCYLSLGGLKAQEASKLRVRGDGIARNVTLLTDEETYTLLRDDYLVNLGYADRDEESELSVSFSRKGTYRLEEMALVYIPMSGMEARIAELKRYAPETFSFADDRVAAMVQRPEDGVQLFSVPYGSGWTARVNGEPAQVLCTDLCYIGLLLPAGASEIELTYRTPGLAAGQMLTAAGLILLLAAWLWFRRRSGKERRI